ncbi:hypothetical protein CRE_24813 [Caenorhabditis remanei]|uniref:Uncharacterized protein n=1 Tax=Caenorhabditis remanei TaxID=31234 RepID=E3NHN0_CAERE|nr:hypothetical protein CRE_24813 [Caenorhabditis remanei]
MSKNCNFFMERTFGHSDTGIHRKLAENPSRF